MKTMTHIHNFQLVRANGSIKRCTCGQWRHANSDNAILEVPRKETLFKTAVAVVGCAQFHPGEIVSLAFYHFDEEGKAWYLIERSERGPLAQPVAYPASLLKDFCL